MKRGQLKEAWEPGEGMTRSIADLRKIIRKPSFPALRIANRNMTIETAAFVVFIGLYYGLFNGDSHLFYGNLLLLSAFLLNIFHNVLLCRFVIRPGHTQSAAESLRLQLKELKRFTFIVIILRSVVICSLVLFFSTMIRLESEKMWLLRGMIVFLTLKLLLFIRFALRWIGQVSQVIAKYHPLTFLLKDDDPVQALRDRAKP